MIRSIPGAFVALLFCALLAAPEAAGQGCVAIRHFSNPSELSLSGGIRPGDLTVGTSYRYFKSFRHFRGTHEEPDRVANSTEVVNHAHAIDLNLTYAVTSQLYVAASLPFVFNTRSSLYEHGRSERYTTFSRGLADARVGIGYWVLPPGAGQRISASAGLSLKLPTGSFNASDIFYNVGVDGRPEVRPVDQSIQPGDGGIGILLDFQFNHRIVQNLSWYGGGFYLSNPRETNGVRTFRETLTNLLANEAITSVPDQYSLRAGVAYSAPAIGSSFLIGIRYEGVPVEDVLGGSAGFRRPGSVFSIEPAVTYTRSSVSFTLAVPVAIVRNRPQSVTDLEMERITGQARHGDAAFADYLISAGISYRIPGRRAPTPSLPNLFDGPELIPSPSTP